MIPDGVRPLSPLGVANGQEPFTVGTSTVLEVHQMVDGYLDGLDAGGVVAVVGSPGAGKTHLVGDIARRCGPRATTVTVEAGAGLVDLYRRLVEELGVAAVTSRVEQWYTTTVLDELTRFDLGQEITRRVETNELTTAEAVRHGAPLIADILRRFERRFEAGLGDKDFSVVLSLLMRDGYSHVVWEWLLGEPPHQVLRDRSIEQICTDERSALTALRVLFRFFGQPFVFVVDDTERLVADGGADADSDCFRRFLETCGTSGVLLVLFGDPKFLAVLSRVTKDRINRVLRMSSFTAEQTEEYLRLTAAAVPFTADIVRYLVDVTDGVPRRVVRLCGALRAATAKGAVLSHAMVRDVVAGQLLPVDEEGVHREVRRVLDSLDVPYSRGPEPVQYLLSPGIAVLLSGSVLTAEEAGALARTVLDVTATPNVVELVLVVLGRLPGVWVRELERDTGCTPLVYDRTTFAEELGRMLRARLRAVQQVPADVLAATLDRIAGSLRMISSRLEVIEAKLDGMPHGG
jgi:hypothetical protein